MSANNNQGDDDVRNSNQGDAALRVISQPMLWPFVMSFLPGVPVWTVEYELCFGLEASEVDEQASTVCNADTTNEDDSANETEKDRTRVKRLGLPGLLPRIAIQRHDVATLKRLIKHPDAELKKLLETQLDAAWSVTSASVAAASAHAAAASTTNTAFSTAAVTDDAAVSDSDSDSVSDLDSSARLTPELLSPANIADRDVASFTFTPGASKTSLGSAGMNSEPLREKLIFTPQFLSSDAMSSTATVTDSNQGHAALCVVTERMLYPHIVSFLPGVPMWTIELERRLVPKSTVSVAVAEAKYEKYKSEREQLKSKKLTDNAGSPEGSDTAKKGEENTARSKQETSETEPTTVPVEPSNMVMRRGMPGLLPRLAIQQRDFAMLKRLYFLHKSQPEIQKLGRFWLKSVMHHAAVNGSMELLQWLHEHTEETCQSNTMGQTLWAGHWEIALWLKEHRPESMKYAMSCAAARGRLNTVKMLHASRPRQDIVESLRKSVDFPAVTRFLLEYHTFQLKDLKHVMKSIKKPDPELQKLLVTQLHATWSVPSPLEQQRATPDQTGALFAVTGSATASTMASTVLEQLRAGQEAIELYERAVVSTLNEKPRNHRERVLHGHKVSNLLDKVVEQSKHVSELYRDSDGTFEEEKEHMRGRAMFTSFYEQLKSIREFHRKYPNRVVQHEPEMEDALRPQLTFADVAESDKLRSSGYETYLRDVKTYLLGFYRKTQPLVDLDDVIAETQSKFDKQWALNQVVGWNSRASGDAEQSQADEGNSLFCRACNKQFTSQGVFTSHLSGKKHKMATKALEAAPPTTGEKPAASAASKLRRQQLAFDEVLIRRLYELLTEVIHGTISYLEVKQTRTHEELQTEIAEEEEGAFSDVDVDAGNMDGEDDEQPFYNPLNLPLGWDGKPIPYWLYKLHGLGVEYKCEICGNHSYWGRREFDRHFQQWRHAHGMRCLGIPNTKHFHDITGMQDAIALYEKLKDQIDQENWNAEKEEEFEDSEGNVLSRKTYEDLARQGLL
ncbi:hypothetical protein P43SY_010158 [Pythium insidiosum]|uniref:C2H2-type domain-containing protein n=1 Tax=Pythium insidiosum TaxID=114742 RepID=A0AAD5Q5D8_PYTIN|nr:hypothetical protein P43SY_010158 [Pythium insidiosum]